MRLRGVLLCVALLVVLFSCNIGKDTNMHLVGWGDSMMSGAGGKKSILEVISQELGSMKHANYGEGGLKSKSVAILQGGLPLKLKFAKKELNTSALGISVYHNDGLFSSKPKFYREGRIDNYKGQLIRNTNPENRKQTQNFTFINKHSSPIILKDTVVFKFDDAVQKNNAITIIWAGRNDTKTDSEIYKTRDNINAMIDNIKPDERKRLLVLSVCNGIGDKEYKGSTAHTRIGNLNTLLQASFKDYFIDIREYMIKKAIYDMGITPSLQDLEDIKKDCIPRRFLSDHVHFNTLGYEAAGKYLAQVIKDKKWIN